MTQTSPSSPLPEDVTVDRLVRSEEEIATRAEVTRRTSKIVRWMRLVLPVVALAIVAVLMIWSNPDQQIKAVPRAEVSPQTVSRNELINPKFQSEDKNSQPYTITADKAVQNADNMDAILLDKPVADISLKSGNWVALKATQGVYNQQSGTLDLDGAVEMHHDTGYELHTDKMSINVDAQKIISDQAVTGHGPTAEITATGLEADGKTDNVIFKGPAKLILRPVNDTRKSEKQE
ncbi:MAG TPA: LPS export ABC transporter periplasmic protein LptC [Alphaproteobacteria bacterium]|nr:LPS export ABC transporter periplasmic protein LptC [Alphaproteobacteria bacterium]